jgi:hypothetical protein
MIRLELLDHSEEKTWDDLVASFEDGTVFHTWTWMQVIEKLRGAEKLPFGIFEGSKLIGVFPLFRRRRGPLTILASPLGGVGYGGPLVSRTYYQAVLEQLDDLLKCLGAGYIEFRSLELLAPSLLADRHYTVQNPHTYVLALNRDPQELWANLDRNCRWSIRKAQKNNVEVVEATDKEFIGVFYEMSKYTYAKSKRPPPFTKEDYSIIWDIMRPQNRVRAWLAQHEGQVVAGAIRLCFNNKLYGWEHVAFPAHYSLRANNLLDWSIIEWGALNGMTQIDVMGANFPSIAQYKKSFGSELRTYTYASKDTTWPAYLGRRLYLWLAPQLASFWFEISGDLSSVLSLFQHG